MGLIKTKKKTEIAVLIAVVKKNETREQANEHIQELEFLAKTAGAKTIATYIQKVEHPDTRTYIGKGKLEEVKIFVDEKKIDLAIFDDDLAPSQVRNLEKELSVKVLDRSLLILDIFSLRAKTRQAKTQVELAQYEYLLPRLTNMWTHLSKQKGGIGMKGPGETELETDRRIVRDKIALLKKKLVKINNQQTITRKGRRDLVRVALVGYTNVGKSTLMSRVSKSDTFIENKLFATLDSLVRKVVLGGIPFLLTDTVGFIRKLPHTLVECFKSTLDEITESDILLHIIDRSHPSWEEHVQVVSKTLQEINATHIPIITVYNKIDIVENDDDSPPFLSLPITKKVHNLTDDNSTANSSHSIYISAGNNLNIYMLRKLLYEEVKKIHLSRYPNYLGANDYEFMY